MIESSQCDIDFIRHKEFEIHVFLLLSLHFLYYNRKFESVTFYNLRRLKATQCNFFCRLRRKVIT